MTRQRPDATGDRAAADPQRAGRSLLASSATVSAFNGLGVLAGFALDAAVAALFGVGVQTDAYFSAYRLPYAIIAVLNMVAGAALVPMFARALSELRSDERQASSPLSDVFSNVFNVTAAITALVTVIGIAGSEWLVTTLYAGLPMASQALAAGLSRILFLSVLLTGAVEVLRSLLYAHKIFGIPTAINLFRSVVTLAVLFAGRALIPGAATSDSIGLHLLAWGVVAGVVAQLLVVGWQASHIRLRWRPLLDLRDKRLRRTGRTAGPITIGAVVRQGINVVETMVAATLPPGSVTIISYANRLTFVISSVFLTSITTASTPAMSQAMAQGRKDQVRALLVSALRLTAFVALPLGVGMAALGVPVIRLLFERGRFTAEASQLTGLVLSFYAISILFLGYSRVVQAYFYAALRTGVVLVLFVVLAVVSIGLDLALAPRLGVQGIAIGFSAGALVSTLLGLWLLWRDRGQWSDAGEESQRGVQRQMNELLLLNGKVAAASLAMAATAVLALQLLPDAAWALAPALAAGGAAFVLAAYLLRVRELWLLRDLLAARASRRAR
jgi:putative peptidoglycan lipid II flippase